MSRGALALLAAALPEMVPPPAGGRAVVEARTQDISGTRLVLDP